MFLFSIVVFTLGAHAGSYSSDTDGSCQLLDAMCDHTGFTITFNKTCADLETELTNFQNTVVWKYHFANMNQFLITISYVLIRLQGDTME